jgi:hypothetical protein
MAVQHSNQSALVNRLHEEHPPARTVEAALEFTLRFILASPAEEEAGLLRAGGENVLDYLGQSVKAGRICYPDGSIVKILTDIPGTNGPSWQDSGEIVDRNRYVPVERTGEIHNPPPPPPPPPTIDMDARLAAIEAKVDANAAAIAALHARVDQIVTDFEKTAKSYLPILDRLKNFGL